jgi:hypothetical protein
LKLLGYEAQSSAAPPQALSLIEVILEATPAELRAISHFLSFAADEMDRMGPTYDHLHLSDIHNSLESSPHLVVVRGGVAA